MSTNSFALSYQKSPIIFVNGVAGTGPNSKLPIAYAVTGPKNGFATATAADPFPGFPFDFYPMPGATLIENQIGSYPFANQAVAANAVITQPLHISLLMIAPARNDGAYSAKLAIFQSLQATIQKHVQMGGLFSVATPSLLYTDCLLLSLRDVSEGDPKRPQDRWQWDFVKPLVTQASAQAALGSLNSKLDSGVKVVPDATSGAIVYSSTGNIVGNPQTGATTGSNLFGSSVPGALPGSTGNLHLSGSGY